MSFNALKQNILELAISGRGDEFVTFMNKNEELRVQWQELYHRKSGDTVIHFAARSGCVKILKYFWDQQNIAILNKVNLDKKTPLHVAAQASQLNCVKFLLSCHVQVDPLKRADWTPLMLACTKENLNVIDELLLHGANPLYKNKDGWTAFHIACREGYKSIIQRLLEFDILLWKTKSNNQRTPLHTAALHGRIDAVHILLEKCNYGADEKDCCGTTPTMDSVSGNHIDVLKLLLEKHKGSAEATDLLGRNLLHIAAQAGALECVTSLVSEYGLNVNGTSFAGLTPLHFAVKEKNIKCVELLLLLGADETIEDGKGRTAEKYS